LEDIAAQCNPSGNEIAKGLAETFPDSQAKAEPRKP
jgi:hypothetical protein